MFTHSADRSQLEKKEVEIVLLLYLGSNKVLIETALVLLSDGRPVPDGCV